MVKCTLMRLMKLSVGLWASGDLLSCLSCRTSVAISYHLNALYLKVGVVICESTVRDGPLGVWRRAVLKAAPPDVWGDVKVD